MKKTLFFVYKIAGGGAEKMLAGVSLYCKMPITFVSHQEVASEFEHKGRVIYFGLDRYKNKLIRNISAFTQTFSVLRKEQPDTVLTCLEHMNLLVLCTVWLCRLFGLLKNTKVIVRIASLAEINNKRKITWFLNKLYTIPETFIVVSNGLTEGFSKRYNIPISKFVFIPNSVDLEYSYDLEQGKQFGDFDIVTIGRYTKAKDHKTLIEAISILKEKYHRNGLRACLFGVGELEQELKSLAKEKGVEDNAIFVNGSEYAVGQAILKRSTLFVFTSLWEGFANVIVEAMRAGLPIVSTRCETGPMEVLEYGKYGYIVPLGDANSLATAIHELLLDKNQLEKYRKLSAQRVLDYNIRKIVEKYDALFN